MSTLHAKSISIKELENLPEKLLIDCREQDELHSGIIAGSIAIPLSQITTHKLLPNIPKEKIVVIYCQSGRRSIQAAQALADLGYPEVYSLEGGILEWRHLGKPINGEVEGVDIIRYKSQIVLSEFGLNGQKKLKEARVLVVGCGGLGSPAALYLVGAGVGTIGIVDDDHVKVGNLHRQILFSTANIGFSKTDVALEKLSELNPETHIETFQTKLVEENIETILSKFDLIMDCTDNFESRDLINSTCVKLRKPNLQGSVVGFQGQIALYSASQAEPCYRCMYPELPPEELRMNCGEAGVLGPVAGVVGTIMATEALKWLTQIGNRLSASVYFLNTLEGEIQKVPITKKTDCPVCSIFSNEP